MTAAEWADRTQGHYEDVAASNYHNVAAILAEAGARRRVSPQPSPRCNREINRLRPASSKRHTLNLGWLGKTTEGRQLRQACPILEHLEFCLRVYHNEGKDNVPLATAATILRKQVVLAFDLQDLDPSDRAPAGQAAHILIGALAMPPLHQPVDGTSPVYLQGWNVSAWVSQEGVTSFQVKSSAMEAPMAQAVQHRLSSTVVASTTSLSRAFSGCSSRALSNARLSALCLPPKVVSDHIPLLPPPCQNIDIRPGILLKEATVAEDFEQSDELEMGMSKARWLQLERSVNAISAALTLGGLRSLFAANVLLGGGST